MLRVRNTLTRRKEQVDPREPGHVRIYTCGPTVYRYAHIGNLRSYLMADWARRALENRGLRITHVKNITDVGHMRQEQLEQGDDKVIAAALAAGKTPDEIAQLYTEAFYRDEARLNILPAHHFPRATEHIDDMITIIRLLTERGYAYEAGGNCYFDVSSFPGYGRLSGNTGETLLEGVRVEADPLKRDPRDFTLWKAAEAGRALSWSSPWGDGFPGWHIECSAMSYRYLGEQLDIHTGGVDNIFPHHEGEIAQSEGAFGKPHVSYWMHGEHLLADGIKMAKSSANDYTLDDLEERGFEPLAFRYLCLTGRYRTRLNFTFSSLRAAQRALIRLRDRMWEWSRAGAAAGDYGASEEAWRERFWDRVEDDLDLPGALAGVWQIACSDLPGRTKRRLVAEFDALLGLGLAEVRGEPTLPDGVHDRLQERDRLRRQGQFTMADAIREELVPEHVVRDAPEETLVRPRYRFERIEQRWPSVSSGNEVPSRLEQPAQTTFSVLITACNFKEDVQRCVDSALHYADGHSVEVVVVDNGSIDGTGEWLEERALETRRLRVTHTDHVVGEATAKNIALKQVQGEYVLVLDTSAEVKGDVFGRLIPLLRQGAIGMVGPWGVVSDDLHHFQEQTEGPVDAMQAYCFAFRRQLLHRVGLMHESFRFYRNLDLEYSFRFKDGGYRILAVEDLPVVRHEHRVWTSLPPAERDALSHRNFRRFLKRWGHRHDLLEHPGADTHDEDHGR